eukprot:TRINITY_DN9876_c0_g1_i3.p1 TRINITY_DN9876_c0_g1~~TRINITY_DN9876_c0_g1_i3.p1  ORF type:complete len:953 (-),score=168.33 TRINITY_DN9876_c0_g1_i3:130-2988(-)
MELSISERYATQEKEMLDIHSIFIENDIFFFFSSQIESWTKYSVCSESDAFTFLLRFRDPNEEAQYHRYNTELSYRRIRRANLICTIVIAFSLVMDIDWTSASFITNFVCTISCLFFSVLPHKYALKNPSLTRFILMAYPMSAVAVILINRTRFHTTIPAIAIIAFHMYTVGIQRISFVQCSVDIFLATLGLLVVNLSYLDPDLAFFAWSLTTGHGICMLWLSRYFIRDIKMSFAKRMAFLFERHRAQEEHSRVRNIANCIVPKSMVDELCRLVARDRTESDYTSRYISSVKQYDQGSFMFATISGPNLKPDSTDPTQMVCAISLFVHIVDSLCLKHKIDRIKCIGPTVLVVSGIPESSNHHLRNMLSFSLELQSATKMLQNKHMLLRDAVITSGIHTGPCLAGVIGLSQFSFDVWGDTINTASRLMTTSESGRIQVSTEVVRLGNGFYYEGRGEVLLKGKGLVQTHYLLEQYSDITRSQLLLQTPIILNTKESMQANDDLLKRELYKLASSTVSKWLIFKDRQMERDFWEETSHNIKDLKYSVFLLFGFTIFFILNDLFSLEYGQSIRFLKIRIVGQLIPLAISSILLNFFKKSPSRIKIYYVLIAMMTTVTVIYKLYVLRKQLDSEISLDVIPRTPEYAMYFYNIELVALFSVLFMLPSASFWLTCGVMTLLFLAQQSIMMSSNRQFISLAITSNVVVFILGIYISYAMESQRRVIFAVSKLIKREAEIIDQQKTITQRLVLSVVPKQIYDRLSGDPNNFGDRHDKVVALFADVVGFTQLSSQLALTEMNEFLHQLFVSFDRLCVKHRLQKLKNLGDCIVVIGGVHHNLEFVDEKPDFSQQVRSMLYLAEEAHVVAERISIELRQKIQFRIGVAIGSCVSGVIGSHKFGYDVWGGVISEANYMESTGTPGKTQVSSAVYLESESYVFYDVAKVAEEKPKYFMISSKVISN